MTSKLWISGNVPSLSANIERQSPSCARRFFTQMSMDFFRQFNVYSMFDSPSGARPVRGTTKTKRLYSGENSTDFLLRLVSYRPVIADMVCLLSTAREGYRTNRPPSSCATLVAWPRTPRPLNASRGHLHTATILGFP